MAERTFIIVKPDAVYMADVILKELDSHGTRTKTVRINAVPKSIVEAHYALVKERKPFIYDALINSFIDQPVVLAIYEGEKGIAQKFLDLVGPTDPSKAPKHTIRGKYGNDSIEQANKEERVVRTVVHRSDSAEDAEREISVWEEFFDSN